MRNRIQIKRWRDPYWGIEPYVGRHEGEMHRYLGIDFGWRGVTIRLWSLGW